MRVAGIDYSTFAVDIVTVPYDDDGPPEWHRYELVARGELDDPFERTREVGRMVPGIYSAFWDDIVAVGIEHPGGKFGTGDMLRVQGAVLSRIPWHKQVEPWPPSKWKNAVGLPGNASKAEVWGFATWQEYGGETSWPYDACDAYCIALATRQAITREAAA